MTLLRVELRRLLARRAVVLLAVAGLAGVLLGIVATWSAAQPLSPADLQQAEAAYERALADWETHGEDDVAACLEAEAVEREATGQDLDFGCDAMAPQREWFVPTPPRLEDQLSPVLVSTAMLVLVVTAAIGITSTAAEHSTGSISTWLTFEPRRVRVYASKLLAAAALTVPLALLLLGLQVLGQWAVHAAHGLAGGMTGSVWADVAGVVLRATVLCSLGAAVGAALGTLLRHTAAVAGLLAGYLVVVEGLLSGLRPALQPWLVLVNVRAWVADGATYWVSECTVDAAGTVCDVVERTRDAAPAAVYLLVGATVLVVVTGLVFRRRDVL